MKNTNLSLPYEKKNRGMKKILLYSANPPPLALLCALLIPGPETNSSMSAPVLRPPTPQEFQNSEPGPVRSRKQRSIPNLSTWLANKIMKEFVNRKRPLSAAGSVGIKNISVRIFASEITVLRTMDSRIRGVGFCAIFFSGGGLTFVELKGGLSFK